nr:PREDICTED: green-sensitive opsin-like [Linepithema humile]
MFLNASANFLDDVLSVEQQTTPGVYIFAAIVLGFIGFFGFFFNLLVILAVFRDMDVLWTPNNVVLVNMVIGDFLVAILGNPMAFVSAIAGEWYWGHKMCLWYAAFMSTMGFASIGNLTMMAIERYILVKYPTKTISIRHAYALVLFVWIYALSLSLPPFVNWGSYGIEAGNISCSVSWDLHDPEIHNDTYIGFLFTFGFFFPLAIIISSYCGILTTLKKIRQRIGENTKREAKITKMVYLMILAFLFAWSPYAILALLVFFNVQVSYVAAMMPALLAKSSICYNPIIYTSMNIQFTRAWKKMFFINKDLRTNKDSRNTGRTIIEKIEMKNINQQLAKKTEKSNCMPPVSINYE